jgi:hypothetical protein
MFQLCHLQEVLGGVAGQTKGTAGTPRIPHVAIALGFSKDVWRHVSRSLCADPLMGAPTWQRHFRVSGERHFRVSGERHFRVSGERHFRVSGERHFRVSGERHFRVSGERHFRVSGERHFRVSGERHFRVSGERHFRVSGAREAAPAASVSFVFV